MLYWLPVIIIMRDMHSFQLVEKVKTFYTLEELSDTCTDRSREVKQFNSTATRTLVQQQGSVRCCGGSTAD